MHSCSYCGKTGKIVKGLCLPCYYRQKKTGSLEYTRKGKRTPCSVEGCEGNAVGGGLCAKHYGRMRRHGHLEQTRPEDWGARNDHPLSKQWNYLHRKRGAALCAPEWVTDFARFVTDVGLPPGEGYRLRPLDRTRLIGPDNFFWDAPPKDRLEGETRQAYYHRMERERRSDDPEYFKNLDLRKKYNGLTLAGVAAMSERQNHRCAICGGEENTVIRGQKITLAVDHDHVTGAIRGLLCVKCNRGLGLFQDSEVFLSAAITYLRNPPGEVIKREPIKRRKPRSTTQMQTGTANDEP